MLVRDAVGRPVHVGDTVGGTTPDHQTTLVGPVLKIAKGRVRIRVTNLPRRREDGLSNADETWLTTDRVFRVHRASERVFRGYRTPDGRVWTPTTSSSRTLDYDCPTSSRRYDPDTLQRTYGWLEAVWDEVPPHEQADCDALSTYAGAAALRTAALRIWDGHATSIPPSAREHAAAYLSRLAAETEDRARTRTGLDTAATTPAPESPHMVRAAAFLEAIARITTLPWDCELDPGRNDCTQLLGLLATEATSGHYPPTFPWARRLSPADLVGFLCDLETTIRAARPATLTPAQAADLLTALETTCTSWRTIADTQHPTPAPAVEPAGHPAAQTAPSTTGSPR